MTQPDAPPNIAIILAGGLGTRLKETVPDLPKPMAPVAGRPFLEHILDHWIANGVDRVVLSVGYRAHMVQDHFGAEYRGCAVDYALESEPLGTGGALLLARRQIPTGRPFLVLNGDTYLDVDLRVAWERHVASGAALSMVLAPHPGELRYESVACDAGWRVQALQQRDGDKGAWINGGVYLFGSKDLLVQEPLRHCSFERDLLPAWLSGGLHVGGIPHRGFFIDIGLPGDFAAANQRFQALNVASASENQP